MWEGFAVVAVHLNETSAGIDLARLEAAGIAGRLATDNCGGMRPHLDLVAGVRLLVAEADAEAARELLGAAVTETAGWLCSLCGADGEPGFDACWSCGHSRA